MTQSTACPQCGSPLPAASSDTVCPACLMENGLKASGAGSFATTVDHGPNTPPRSETGLIKLASGDAIGEYRIVRPLGHGGMGAVYEAEQTTSGRRLALKLLGHSLDSPEARKRFFREGRLAASVNHPNSVYVYGTEDLGGTPAISMELVAGGTLQQQVKERGPLPISEAVDTILQVIAGLEAAQSLGVLHRDVKPSNCFVDADGSVKVGDFGLSISTFARGESQLTSSGAFLGTPAFSSPEQLKGDELDVRSDIYAVGVTLYYLLTGHTPFAADNVVKLLATVLEQPAPSPTKWRGEIPGDLAKVVLRCLEKQPAQRYRNYADLRAALRPFSSTAPVPAGLPLRFLAGTIDQIVLVAVSFLEAALLTLVGINTVALISLRAENYAWFFAVGLSLELLYFAVPEGLWGASFGKWVCGLRVVNAKRSAPGFLWALVRAAIYVVLPVLPTWIATGGDPNGLFSDGRVGVVNWLILMSFYPLLALLFCTARRRNGYAGLHDLAIGSRVIVQPRYAERPTLPQCEESPAAMTGTEQIGPYHVLEPLGASDGAEWLLGYDTRLLRKVWIRRLPQGSPPVETALRNVARIGRLRWLGGKRTANECWDVYEAAAGVPLATLIRQPQSWNAVRYWLFDLAQELAAGLKDGTLPAGLALDRLWITADGRLKLLDFPAPTAPVSTVDVLPTAAGEVGPTRLFLQQVAASALAGRELSPNDAHPQAFGPLPLHATQIVQGLAHVQRPEVAAAQLGPVLHRPVMTSRGKRWGLLAGCLTFPLACALFVVGIGQYSEAQKQQFSQLQPLHELLEKHSPIIIAGTPRPLADGEREALEIYIAGDYGDTIRDPEVWSNFYSKITIPQWERDAAERIVAKYPAPTEAEVAHAKTVVEPMMAKTIRIEPLGVMSPAQWGLVVFAVTLLAYVAAPSVAAALCFRGGLLLAMFGVVGVTHSGERASRLRMFGRALLLWLPVLAAPFVLALGTPLVGVAGSVGIMIAGYLILAVWSVMLPERGLADRLAGTWLVPR